VVAREFLFGVSLLSKQKTNLEMIMTKQHLIIIIMAFVLAIGGCETTPEQKSMPQSFRSCHWRL